jgi:hypothetical protein
MFYTKLAPVTFAFYLGISILIDAAIMGMALWRGSFGIFLPKTGWVVFFGSMWLVSFLLAWRIVVAPLLARLHAMRN